jgi:DNA-binding transcriptional ArsR family regulator
MDRVAQALSDPIRREILRRLRGNVATAGALASSFEVSRPAVSRHLRVLREADLVRQTPNGREREYRLRAASLTELQSFLAELCRPPEAVWQQRFDALATEVHRARRKRLAAEAPLRARKRRKRTA